MDYDFLVEFVDTWRQLRDLRRLSRLKVARVVDGPAERPGNPERDLPERPWSPEPEHEL